MSDKRQQLDILDQWASQSGQVSRSTERLNEIERFIDWEPLYQVGHLARNIARSWKPPPSAQIDTDADSTKKGDHHYFGSKGHIGMDVGSNLIHSLSFTAASPHDSTQLEEVLSGDQHAIFGDKAYPSKDLKFWCRWRVAYYGGLDKAYRNRPLSSSQNARDNRNRQIRRYVLVRFRQ